MLRNGLALAALFTLAGMTAAKAQAPAADEKPVVIIETSAGTITVELDPAKAPKTVENFLKYVDKGFYEGVVFHRVIPGFMIQTGGMTETNNTLKPKLEGAFPPVVNESGNGLSNLRGTLAMARTNNPNSATSQFFINLVDNTNLDNYGGGYCVFGKVTAGMDVVDAIAKAETGVKQDTYNDSHRDVPAKPITVKSAKRKPKA